MKMRRGLVAGLLLSCVFLSGVVSGVVLEQVAFRGQVRPDHARLSRRFDGPPPWMGEGARERGARRGSEYFVRALTERLHLSEEQAVEVRTIIEDHDARMAEVMGSIRPRMQAQFDSLRASVREVLTPEQREAFKEFVEEGFRRMGGKPPRGRSRPGGPSW